MTKKSKSTNSTNANVQPNPEGGPEAAPGSPVRKPRLSPGLKAEADRIIAKRERKARKETGIPKEKREPKERQEDLVVFAFRLTSEEREAIHNFAGPAKASSFVRSLAAAAARGDSGAVAQLLKGKAATG